MTYYTYVNDSRFTEYENDILLDRIIALETAIQKALELDPNLDIEMVLRDVLTKS